MIDYALKYDKAILNGKITACHDIKLACKIDLMNRKKSNDPGYPYYYDHKIANNYIRLAKVISPQPLALFQLWWLSCINGYRFKSDPKIRKNNNTILSMARKNAKSYLASIAMVSYLIDGEIKGKTGKQFYFIASKKAQAMLSLRTCRGFIKRLQISSKLARNFKLNKDTIYSTITGSYIKALPSRSNSLDGLRVDGCCLDECHSISSPKLLEVLQSAMGQSPDGIIIQTSTSGFDYNCPFHKDVMVAEKELEDKDTNSRSFNAIYIQDNKDEIYKNHDSWVKSNPLLSVSKVRLQMKLYLKDQLNKALASDRSNSVLVKNFNTWGNLSDKSFIDPDKWKANEVKPIDLYNCSNVVIGLDLARVHDLTATSITVPLENGTYYTTTHAFVADVDNNISKKSKADDLDYLALEKAGNVTICRHSYGLIDYRVVTQYIVDLINKYHWKDCVIAYDPWQAGDVVNMLGSEPNINLIKVSQSVKNLTNIIQWLYRLILSHKLTHDDNPLYDYCFSNLVANYNVHGNIYLGKKRANSNSRIDCCFALLDSLFVQKSLQNQNKNNILSKELDNNNFTF